jgi:hypothetical protein
LFFELVPNGERWNDVTAGASACNDYAHEISIRETNRLAIELRKVHKILTENYRDLNSLKGSYQVHAFRHDAYRTRIQRLQALGNDWRVEAKL